MQNLHNIFFVCLLSLAQVLYAAQEQQPSNLVAQPASSNGPLISSFIDTIGSPSEQAYSSNISVPEAIRFIKSIEKPGSTFGCDTEVAIPFKTIYGSGESRMDISYLFQPLGCQEPCEHGFMWPPLNVSFVHSLTAGSLPFLFAMAAGGYFEWSKEKVVYTAAFLGLCAAAYGFYAKRQPVAISSTKLSYKKVAVKRELDNMLREATSLDPQHSTLRWDRTSLPADAATKYPRYQGVQTAHGSVIDYRTSEYREHERNRLSSMHTETLDLEKLQSAHEHNQSIASNLYPLIDSVTMDRPVFVGDELRFSRLVMSEIEEHATARAAEGEEAYDQTQWAGLLGVPLYPKTNSMFVHEFYKYWQHWHYYEQQKMEAKRNNVANGLILGGLTVACGALHRLLSKLPTS